MQRQPRKENLAFFVGFFGHRLLTFELALSHFFTVLFRDTLRMIYLLHFPTKATTSAAVVHG